MFWNLFENIWRSRWSLEDIPRAFGDLKKYRNLLETSAESPRCSQNNWRLEKILKCVGKTSGNQWSLWGVPRTLEELRKCSNLLEKSQGSQWSFRNVSRPLEDLFSSCKLLKISTGKMRSLPVDLECDRSSQLIFSSTRTVLLLDLPVTWCRRDLRWENWSSRTPEQFHTWKYMVTRSFEAT